MAKNGFALASKKPGETMSSLQAENQFQEMGAQYAGKTQGLCVECVSCHYVLPLPYDALAENVAILHRNNGKPCDFLD